MNNDYPICISEECWANNQLSVVRYTGQISFNSHIFMIVNKDGIDIFALSHPNSKYYVGKNKQAIHAGEPCDLCRLDFIKYYRALKRDAFIRVLKKHPNMSDEELKATYERMIAKKAKR